MLVIDAFVRYILAMVMKLVQVYKINDNWYKNTLYIRCRIFILRHACLNCRDNIITDGIINEVAAFIGIHPYNYGMSDGENHTA